MLLQRTAASALVYVATAMSAQGQTPAPATATDTVDQVTVTATRMAERVSDAIKPITTIDRARIEEINPSTVFDLLDTVPGLSIARSGGLEGQISLRGFNSNYYHSPLFIDGDRFKGRNTLEYLLLEPEDIDRVEVIRGPAAEAYGSEAVSGVVLIGTAHATPVDGDLRVLGGDGSLGFASVNDETQAHGDVEVGGHGFGARLSVSGRDAGSYETPQGLAHNSAYKTANVGADFVYALDANQKLDLSAREITVGAERAGGLGGAPGYPYVAQRDELQAQTGRLAYTGDFDHGVFRHLSADVFVDNFNGEIPSIKTTTANQIAESISYVVGPLVIGGNLLGVAPWTNGNSTLGLDFFDEMRPDGSQSAFNVTNLAADGGVANMTDKARTQTTPGDRQANVGVFADNVWNPSSRWTLTGAGRVDVFHTETGTFPVLASVLQPLYAENSDRTNVAVTGSLGWIYHVSPKVDIVGDVGNVFRMPSDTELFSTSVQGTGYALPNPALQPEHGEAVEGGLRFHAGASTASLTAYYNRYRDFVETVPVVYLGTPSTQPQNVQRVDLEGAEGDITIPFSRSVTAYGNFTYTRATDLATDEPLPYISPLHGLAGVRMHPVASNYSVHAEIDWSAAKNRIAPGQEYPTGGYIDTKVGAEVSLGRYSTMLANTWMVVTVDNLFNVAYHSGATYANMSYPVSMTNPLLEPGRNLRVTLRHRF